MVTWRFQGLCGAGAQGAGSVGPQGPGCPGATVSSSLLPQCAAAHTDPLVPVSLHCPSCKVIFEEYPLPQEWLRGLKDRRPGVGQGITITSLKAVQIPAPTALCCATLAKTLNLSVLLFLPPLHKGQASVCPWTCCAFPRV